MRTKETALKRFRNWKARGDLCPICKKEFRTGCNHSVQQARDRLFENYIKTIK